MARWFEGRGVQCCIRACRRTRNALFKRDFTGSCSLFGIVFQKRYSEEDVFRFIDSLALFGIGASWGGYESLALPTTGFITRTATSDDLGGFTVRIHIGLEDVGDLIADLDRGWRRCRSDDMAGMAERTVMPAARTPPKVIQALVSIKYDEYE